MVKKLVGEGVTSGEFCNQIAASEITDLSLTTTWRERRHLGSKIINGSLLYKIEDCMHYEQISGELILTCAEVAENRCITSRQARRWAAANHVPELKQKGEFKGYEAVEWIKPYNEWLLKVERI